MGWARIKADWLRYENLEGKFAFMNLNLESY